MIENILKNLIEENSNTFYGIFIAVIVVVLLFGIIAFLNNNKKFTILSFAIGLILLPFLSFQMTKLQGAIDVRCSLDNADEFASSIRQDLSDATDMVSDAIDMPEISTFLGSLGNNVSGFGEEMLEKAYTYLNWYIVRRCAWSLGFITVAVLGIIITMRKNYRGHGEYVSYDSSIPSSGNEFGF